MAVFPTTVIVTLFCTSFAAPQQTEINDKTQATDLVTPVQAVLPVQAAQQEIVQPESIIIPKPPVKERALETTKIEKDTRVATQDREKGFTVTVYRFISEPIIKAINAPKVNEVLRNIGTCVVNGAMELVSFYLPTPIMPLLASVAGLVIPFEPVVMLKQRMPVTSYRRAFQTAINTFLRTFDKYKVPEEFDPYMTRRFNRRFMNDNNDQGGKTPELPEVK